MNAVKIIHGVLACAFVLSGAPARAQGDHPGDQLTSTQLMNNTVLIVTPDGRVVARPMRPGQVERAMAGAQPVANGTIFVERNGQLFITQDHPMPNGRMLSQQLMNAR